MRGSSVALHSFHVDELADLCAGETTKYMRREPSDPQYCFELLRRALAEAVGEALTHVYRIYEPLVLSWVHKHERFAHTGEDASYFASMALRNCYFALRGAKFANFQFLPQVLGYLKRCVHSAIEQYIRDQHPLPDMPLEHVEHIGEASQSERAMEAQELWNYILRLLPQTEDQLLARLTFVLDMKPAEIVRLHPAIWQQERQVSVALQRIRRMLRRNDSLRQMAGETE
jgi:hypothetical protein